MNVFEVMGPVMVGPSSSHTLGAVKIGLTARQLLQEEVQSAEVLFHGSFLATGKGHGTDKAIIAGLLGIKPDDERISDSFRIAEERGMKFSFGGTELRHAHPNSVLLKLVGKGGRKLEVVGSSLGGGGIKIDKIDGLDANFCACYPTLIIHNVDQPGHVAEVTSMLGRYSVNIATLQLYRDKRGGRAVMVIECDQEVPEEMQDRLKKTEGILKVTYLSMEEKDEFPIIR
ncbi:MAG TPA: L-serine ammonia-lyase, iron-sulfur-dependent, subunit beta [Lachnospiraceae bacterium]|jgi:L-serine dehydratase|nr:L-serine ammonia-lyase, iron-sulfur-dependent, subunit beta [Lachnospiraceae bacterium]HBY71679.1 L-serine ammonia-lyase, iron-sulfur-dependent, subunit beta [Lachnospiraceae bacterium]HCA70561.1 L-serine ammonia-lyase, iron-sulfur-dependent, subunit beta [Lachnospiraceae bacterium]HCM13246.1 L-serine ammonia-lyase, iron-sulfur-dependent, subunit beta [Lachnospiraceae bacterium]HCR39459.1 L-serine ammonia-lyase, iron-sulfur-dependent, subunit beta [Lachnospiraceae bacterium]